MGFVFKPAPHPLLLVGLPGALYVTRTTALAGFLYEGHLEMTSIIF
jgi:hypothetical protein